MINLSKKKFIIIVVAVFLVGGVATFGGFKLAAFAGVGNVTVSSSQYNKMEKLYDKYKKLDELANVAARDFYEEVNQDNLMTGMYKGLFKGLGDPYSAYLTKEEFKSWEESTSGEYSGIGISFGYNEDGQAVVSTVNKGGPAEKAGVKKDDVIVSVDGQEFENIETMSTAIRGDEGTKVNLLLNRKGTPVKIKATRAKIINQTVESQVLDGNIGYVSISGFEERTSEDFKKAFTELEKKKVTGVVVDLRDNGGGLVDDAVEIADMFLDKGVVTYVQDREGNQETYQAVDGKTSIPIVVLVNESTASSSEILTGALQDNGVKVVGENTFGKGIIQETVPLSGGDAYTLTILQYFSPKGNQIHEKGIKPDYAVKADEKTDIDEQLEKAKTLLRK